VNQVVYFPYPTPKKLFPNVINAFDAQGWEFKE